MQVDKTVVVRESPFVVKILHDDHYERRLRACARTSPSQIDSYEKCPRIWFKEKIEGTIVPSTPAQERGTAIHALIESSLHQGKLADEGHEYAPIVRDGMHLWPNRSSGEWVVEQAFALPTYDGGPVLNGVVDLAVGNAVEVNGEHGFSVDVWDHKSTSDFKYCKTEEELIVNTQMVAYAKWGYEAVAADSVRIGHLYYRTKMPPRSRALGPIDVSRGHVQSQWDIRLGIIKEMAFAATTVAKANDLPALGAMNVDGYGKTMCDRYGGCAHRVSCGFDTLGGRKMGDGIGMSLTERLKAANGAKNLMPPTTQSENAPGYAPPHANVEGYQREQPCNGKGYYASENGQGFIAIETGHVCPVCKPTMVVPPDAPARDGMAAPPSVPPEKAKRGRKPKADPMELIEAYSKLQAAGFTTEEIGGLAKRDELNAALLGTITPTLLRRGASAQISPSITPPTNSENPTTVAVAPSVQEIFAPGSFFPSKNAMEAILPGEQSKSGHAPTQSPSMQAQSKLEQHVADNRKTQPKLPPTPPIIFVDCVVTKDFGQYQKKAVHLADWLAPIAELAAQVHVDDKGNAAPLDHWGLAPYGRGRFLLAAAIRECLDSCPEVLLVDSSMSGADVAMEVLRPHAAMIVQPLK